MSLLALPTPVLRNAPACFDPCRSARRWRRLILFLLAPVIQPGHACSAPEPFGYEVLRIRYAVSAQPSDSHEAERKVQSREAHVDAERSPSIPAREVSEPG